MKLSEAIRNAVDNHLASSYGDLAEKGVSLFGAFNYTMPARQALDITIGTSEYSLQWNNGEEFKQAQAVRFMYAEFLALEAEDEEELAINSRINETQIG